LRDWDIFTLIVVDDPVTALQRWAQAHRRKFSAPVIAVTGSNGKTTTKEFIASALSGLGPILRTEGTLNNHLGVPMTLLGMTAKHRAAVVEMGMNHEGEIRLLGQTAQADFGVITNTGQAHLESFPSLDALIDAKWELVETLSGEQRLILNRDDTGLVARGRTHSGAIRWFGIDTPCEWQATSLEQETDGCWRFAVRGTTVRLSIPGRHMVYNALSAMATAELIGVSPDEAAVGIEHTASAERRMRSLCVNDVLVLDDAYNANPSSVRAALQTLMTLPPSKGGRRIAVLGGMRELGEQSGTLHREIGSYVASLGVTLLTVGTLAKDIADAAQSSGVRDVTAFETHAEAGAWLVEHLQPGDVVLVKGSRSEHMETVIEQLQENLS
jgi:UDP-N-acetylmuramoyl-tripeptide--D-alanyl-D-alanine ligase